jgi:glycosyltransferase involved in cell wall biosynthesis
MQMKSNASPNNVFSYDYDKNITLSVSMIVKNEEKMLSACLEGLKPLLDAVPSELVIVDTGSVDKTVEIARRYTDKIFHFDWVNDFSAARNFGLEKCRGMWFMFLDADDHFADVAEMIEFFNNEDIHKNYNNAYYITRNFTSTRYDEYFSFCAHRIARRTDNLRFKGAIHEYFTGYYNPAYYFTSYAWHYGYAFESLEEQAKKSERNLELLEKELEKDPDSLRNIYHVVGSMVYWNDKKRALVERALILADKSDEPVSFTAYFKAFEMYNQDKNPDKALAVLDRAIKKAKPDDAILTEAYACKGLLLYNTERFDQAEQTINKYLEYLDRFERGELDKSALGFVIAIYTAPEKRDSFETTLAMCLIKQGKAAQEKLIAHYDSVIELGDDNKTALLEKMLEKHYFSDRTFAENFKNSNGRFAKLMKICADENVPALEGFFNSFGEKPLPEGFSAAIELALKEDINLGAELSKMDFELMRAHLSLLVQHNADLPALAINYQNNDFFFSSIKNLLFATLLFEAACHGAMLQKSEVYRRFINYSSLYVANVYNPDLLNESDIGVLPESHRFGYFMGAAQKLLDSGDRLGYIRGLKKALASCNSMQDIIKFTIDEFSAML